MYVQVWGSGWEFTFNDKEVKAVWWTALGMVVIFEVYASVQTVVLTKKCDALICFDGFWHVGVGADEFICLVLAEDVC